MEPPVQPNESQPEMTRPSETQPNAAGTFEPDDARRVLDCPTCSKRMELIQLERFVGWWCPDCDPRPTTGTWPPVGADQAGADQAAADPAAAS